MVEQGAAADLKQTFREFLDVGAKTPAAARRQDHGLCLRFTLGLRLLKTCPAFDLFVHKLRP